MSQVNLNMSLKELLENQLEAIQLFKAEATCNYWKDDYHIHTTITNDKIFATEEEAEADMREFIVNDIYNMCITDFDINVYQICQGYNLLRFMKGSE